MDKKSQVTGAAARPVSAIMATIKIASSTTFRVVAVAAFTLLAIAAVAQMNQIASLRGTTAKLAANESVRVSRPLSAAQRKLAARLSKTGDVTEATNGDLVYVCTRTPCSNAQEFEVFDGNGAPIYSIGEYGGDAIFGDNRSDFEVVPGFQAAGEPDPGTVWSYTTPAAYAAGDDGTYKSCTAPPFNSAEAGHLTWIYPGGVLECGKDGVWVRKQYW